ncbi:MAG: ArsA family ATPase [Acidimicrobiia bacterium]
MLDRRLLVVTGKGGVGKSAITAAISLEAARRGARVLAVAMGDSRGLASHLGTAGLGYRPIEVRPGVWGAAVIRSRALDEYLHLQLRVPSVAPLRPLSKMLDALADTVPGIRDVITMGKPVFEAEGGSWDLVVADAPPTGQVMSYLRAPATVAGLVPAGRVQQQAVWMASALADAGRSGLVVAALAEEIPMTETAAAVAALAAEPLIDVAAVVVNRVLAPSTGSPPTGVGAVAAAARLHNSLRRQQQRWLTAAGPHRELPYLFGMLTPGEVAARLADVWEQQ